MWKYIKWMVETSVYKYVVFWEHRTLQTDLQYT